LTVAIGVKSHSKFYNLLSIISWDNVFARHRPKFLHYCHQKYLSPVHSQQTENYDASGNEIADEFKRDSFAEQFDGPEPTLGISGQNITPGCLTST
jgi:hypothetical protein